MSRPGSLKYKAFELALSPDAIRLAAEATTGLKYKAFELALSPDAIRLAAVPTTGLKYKASELALSRRGVDKPRHQRTLCVAVSNTKPSSWH